MNLHELVSQLIIDTKGSASLLEVTADSSLGAFLPELTICATIVLMLLVRLFSFARRIDAFYLALAGVLVALYADAPWQLKDGAVERMEIFTGMLVYDGLTVFMRGLLLVFAALLLVFCKLSGIPDKEDSTDVYTMFLGATLGLFLMCSANHLLMIFMAIEMASVPSYALSGLMKGRRVGSEAALKFAVYGAGAAGVMLYGISLVAGLLNTVHLPSMAAELSRQLPQLLDGGGQELMVLALGGLMIGVGLAFKLSAFPFHFWAPDVFEGATAEVNAFLSIASKAAALTLLVRVAVGFGAIPPEGVVPGHRSAKSSTATEVALSDPQRGMFSVSDETQEGEVPDQPAADAGADRAADEAGSADAVAAGSQAALGQARGFIAKLIAFFAILTCTFGNLAAYGQTNVKRLMAYSTIAHAGYMMMAVPPVMALVTVAPQAAETAVAGLAIYLVVYLFMNLCAFAVIAFLRNAIRSEEIADYGGLIRHCPGIVLCFSLTMFSLVGLPPLAGFIGKFAVFGALADGYRLTTEPYLILLLVAGGINTAISLFYYLRVVKVMTMSPEPESRMPFNLPLVSLQGMYVLAITVPTAILIVGWDALNTIARSAVSQLIS